MVKCGVSTIQPGQLVKTIRTLLALLAIALFVPGTHGQTIAGQNAAQTTAPAAVAPTIVTTVDEVTLDLVVRDKKHKPVLDLKPDDIAVTDNSSTVKLSDLRLVTGATSSRHLITLVFDRLEPSAAKNAHDIAAKILKLVPADGFSFSVLNVEGRLRLFQGFTSDRVALGKAINSATAVEIATGKGAAPQPDDAAVPEKNLIAVAQTGKDPSGTMVSAEERDAARVMLAALQESQRIVQDQHSLPSLAGLLALARTEREITGRKVVIFFEQGPELDSNARDMLRSIIGAANRSGVSIYAVDANALDAKAREGLISTVAIGNTMSSNNLNPAPTGPAAPHGAYGPGMITEIGEQYSRFENQGLNGSNEPLTELAESTGGAYILSSDNLKKPLERLLEDLTTYYEASYVPPIQEYDGTFRSVAIQPIRKGLLVRSRAGYFALPSGTSSGMMRPFEAPLMKILGETQLPADLKFNSGVLRLGDLPDGNANSLVVEVPLAELEIRQDPNADLFYLHLSVVAQIKNKAGTVIEHFGEDIPRHGALESLEKARAEVVTLQRHFVAAPGEYVVEVVVQDRNSGKTGAQRTDFEIANPPAGPSLSDLVLVRRTDPLNVEADPLEPMRYETGRVVPNLSGHLSPDAKAASLFFVVHPDASVSEPPTLELEVLRNGEPVGRAPLPLHKGSGQGIVPYLASIPASALPAGSYEVTATLTQGGRSSEHGLSFRVDGPELASAAAGTKNAGAHATEGEPVSDANIDTPGIASRQGHPLIVTSLPPDAVSAPSQDELQAIIADARKRAIKYSDTLPNFMCVEMTDRSIDPSGNGRWRHKDSIAELLRFVDNSETRQTLAVNGKPSATKHEDFGGKNGALSWGEFGGVLSAVFQLSSKADFQWKETDAIGSETVQVLAYRVARENSSWGLAGDDNWKLYPGFHGLLYIDSATRNVRRITLEADELPHDFSIHSAGITVDYDYIAIGTHDYLMPVRGTVSLRQGKREAVLNEIEFRNYKRYGSKVKILYGGQPLQ
jgi:VWFA-related protein